MSITGATITLDPSSSFFPGELVQATATSGIQSTSGEPATSRVWQFRSDVPSGSGVFTDSGQSLGFQQSVDVALGDMDGDGDLDAFAVNFAGPNVVWLNNDGVFSDSLQSLGSDGTASVALGDLDGDGDLDAFVTNGVFNPQVNRVWLNDGTGLFSDSGQSLGNDRSIGVSIGDLDGDGDLDALVANFNGGNRVWWNNGTGLFSDSGQSLGNNPSIAVALGDLDRDGDLDAFVANAATTAGGDGQPNRVWLNDAGIFSDSGQGLGNHVSLDVGLGDLDGDGDLDAFVANDSGEGNRVWLNNAGQFSESGQSLGNHNSEGVALGDLDGDGDLDAFVINNVSNRVWLNNGGQFDDSGQSLADHGPFGVALGDLDGDGDLDAFVGNQEGEQQQNKGNLVWLNNGSGQFTHIEQDLGHSSGSVSLADLDGDGDLDAFMANYRDPNDTNSVGTGNRVWLNSGSGVFTDSGQSLGDHRSFGVSLGDLDGDGDLDAFVANAETSPVGQGNRVWLNDGGGQFSDSGQILGDRTSFDVSLGDLDGDGDLDAFVANRSAYSRSVVGVNSVWLNNGGQFSRSGQSLGDHNSSGVSLGDLDGDGDLDALVTNAEDHFSGSNIPANRVWLNQTLPPPLPSVTLSVDTTTIVEAEGTATLSAMLSAASTQNVTIDLGFSGTVTAGADYTTSSTQISIPAGSLSGTATITAVQDSLDEPDETVIVAITGIQNGTEAGTQQVTIIITDDDEPPVPIVILAVDNAAIAEEAGVATFEVTLSEATTVPVTVDLGISGSATSADDYTVSGSQVVFAPGTTIASITVSAVDDEVNEPDETVIVDITSVSGGNEDGVQQQTITIVDDDVPPSFAVTSLEPTPSGFQVEFTNELDASELNLYDTQNAGLGPADVVVTGASSGAVTGSLVIGTSAITFIKSSSPLAADSYTVTLRSAADGFKDTGGMVLDGNADGTAGDDYVSNFTVAEASAGTRTISIPDFVRGPGQAVNLPADETTGIPITISGGDNVRAADIRISYDPALLEITGATAPAGGSVIVNTTTTPGVAILVFFSSASLPAGSSTFIDLQATVPAGADNGSQQVLDLHSVTVGDGNDNEFPVVVDDALHFTTYFADVSGNGRVNASDAAQVARFAALIDGGFAASLNTDPIVVGDISGNGRINAADASRVAQFAALIDVPEIPPIPAGIAVSSVADLGPGLPNLELPERQVAWATSEATDIQSSGGSLLPQVGDDPYQAVDTVMASMVMLDEDERLILALEDAMAELLSAELLAD